MRSGLFDRRDLVTKNSITTLVPSSGWRDEWSEEETTYGEIQDFLNKKEK